MVKDLKVVLEKGKGGGSKKTKKAGKNAEKNVNKTLGLFKKDQYFGIYRIGRTWWCMMQLIDTLLDIPGKTKYTLNARMDLEEIKLRKGLDH
jgi:hypothetical protein